MAQPVCLPIPRPGLVTACVRGKKYGHALIAGLVGLREFSLFLRLKDILGKRFGTLLQSKRKYKSQKGVTQVFYERQTYPIYFGSLIADR